LTLHPVIFDVSDVKFEARDVIFDPIPRQI
jgi:hypothetical protein